MEKNRGLEGALVLEELANLSPVDVPVGTMERIKFFCKTYSCPYYEFDDSRACLNRCAAGKGIYDILDLLEFVYFSKN